MRSSALLRVHAAAATTVAAGPLMAAEGGGMPQLNPSTFGPQLVWLAITFIGLYLVMTKVLLPRVGGAIEGRRDRVAADLDQAEAFKAETERAIEAYEAALAEARARAGAIAAETMAKVSAEAAAERGRVEAELARRVAEAEGRIADSRETALAEIEKVAADVAGDIVMSLTGEKASEREIAEAMARARSA